MREAVLIGIGFLVGLNVGLFIRFLDKRNGSVPKTPNKIRPKCYFECGNTIVSQDGNICLSCGSSIINKNL